MMKKYPYQINADNIKLVIKVCQMYYEEGMSEMQIAESLGFSRSQVSKILLAARNQKIVNITITNPFFEESYLEKMIADKYGIDNVLLLNSSDTDYKSIISSFSPVITTHIASRIKNNSVIGITSGFTINAFAENIGYIRKKDIKIIPLVGGGFSGGPAWQANINAHLLANRWKCEYMQFNMPGFVSYAEIKGLLLDEPEIKSLLIEMDRTDTAFFGIGEFSDVSTFTKANYLNEDEISELKSKGTVGGICNFFYDEDGKLIDFSGYDRMIGVTPQCVKNIPTRIGLAFGTNKVVTINAALKGKWINYLITDVNTAAQLVK